MSDVHMTLDLAAPIGRVWSHLANREKLSAWLMANDFSPAIGTRFTFTAPPSGTWDGQIHCEVIEFAAERRLSFTWNANDIGAETLVTFELEEVPTGTRLTLTHTHLECSLPGARGRHAAGWTRKLKSLRQALGEEIAGYDWSDFQVTLFVEAPMPQVFARWATSAGLESFWAEDVVCYAPDGRVRDAGETFLLGDRIALTFTTASSAELEIINAEQDRFVAFSFGDDYGWVYVSLSEEDDRTKVVLCHFGLPAEEEDHWNTHMHARGWWVYNLMNLKSIILHGHDIRVREPGAESCLNANYVVRETEPEAPHDWGAFDVFLHIRCSPEQALSRWRTAEGISSFFVGEATFIDASGTPRSPSDPIVPGDRYEWRTLHDYPMSGNITEATPDRVAFTFGANYSVEITAAVHGSGTLLRLHQSGMGDDRRERVQGSLNCRSCWIYFLAALKGRIEHGIDLRDRRPDTADAISVGYNHPDLAY